MATTKSPTGLTITRNNSEYAFKWKIGDSNYGRGQKLEWRLVYAMTSATEVSEASSWTAITVGNTTTSKAVTVSPGSYYPSTQKKLAAVQFRVKGRRKKYTSKGKTVDPAWSGWASCLFVLEVPNKPTNVTAEKDSSLSNKTKFSWEASSSGSDKKIYAGIQYQAVLVKNFTKKLDDNCAAFTGSTLVQGTSSNTSGNIDITEDGTTLAGNSYTRIFRVRSRGMRGDSGWVYTSHVYAIPNKPKITKSSCVKGTSSRKISLSWDIAVSADHPVDSMEVQYYTGTPGAGMTCPAGASWTTIQTVANVDGTSSADVYVDAAVDKDECMWVRVVARHDDNSNYSEPSLVEYGRLSDPTYTSAVVNGTRVTVTASNNSNVPDSKLAILLITEKQPSTVQIIGIMTGPGTTVNCPDLTGQSYRFGVRAFVGSYTSKSDGNVTKYTLTTKMTSADVMGENQNMPKAPESVTAQAVDQETIKLSWDWSWPQADGAIISWSERADSWESTVEPSTYTVNQKKDSWNVGKLEAGKTYYFRVKLKTDDVESNWSDIVSASIDSTALPLVLSVVDSVVNLTDSIVLTMSGTGRTEVAEWTPSGIVENDGYPVILEATDSARVNLPIESINDTLSKNGKAVWTNNSIHYLVARLIDGDWSDPVAVTIVEPASIRSITSSLASMSISDDTGISRTVTALKALPLNVTVTGAGAGGTTVISLIRAEGYSIYRPDEKNEQRYEGEIVAAVSRMGEEQISINIEDLSGALDDGASYILRAEIIDGYGQKASQDIPFEVHWTHQPEVPEIESSSHGSYNMIKAIQPDTYAAGDVIDIYRLSTDAPELIIENGAYNVDYVDPYPAFGEHGGLRVVAKTANGDYITEENTLAWTDAELITDHPSVVISFGGQTVDLPYDISLSHSWNKDFVRTSYLGGSVQGDWNPAVTRDLNINTDVVLRLDDQIQAMRDLAGYAGICHVRTPEGSSFSADVSVSEDQSYESSGIVKFKLGIKAVDSQELDGMTLAEWISLQEDE